MKNLYDVLSNRFVINCYVQVSSWRVRECLFQGHREWIAEGSWRFLKHTFFFFFKMSPEGAVRGLPELLVHLLSSWQLCCITNNPMNRSRSKKARDWRGGGGSGVQYSPQSAVGAPHVCVWGEGAHCPPRREMLGSVTSCAKCSLSGRWQVQTLAFPSLAR